MNALRNRWRSGLVGKLVILAGFVLLCAMCGIVATLLPEPNAEKTAEPVAVIATTSPPAAVATATLVEAGPTATAPPTETPAPTLTPTVIPLPTVTPVPLSPEEALMAGILARLSDGNRDVPRVKDVILADDGSISVSWAINDNFTAGYIKSGARADVVDILRAVRDSGLPVTRVDLAGTFSMVDVYGKTSESIVVSANYSADTLAKLNLDNILLEMSIYEAADSIKVHPEFLGE